MQNCVTCSGSEGRQNWRKRSRESSRQNLGTAKRMAAGRTWEQQKGWQQAELEKSRKDCSRQNSGTAERMAAGRT